MSAAKPKLPLRGEIWFTDLYVDPPEKGRRPVIVVSVDARNRHERVNTVLAVPLSTSIHKHSPVHVLLRAGETGLASDSIARADDITVILKADLVEPRSRLRTLSDKRVCELAAKLRVAMGCAV